MTRSILLNDEPLKHTSPTVATAGASSVATARRSPWANDFGTRIFQATSVSASRASYAIVCRGLPELKTEQSGRPIENSRYACSSTAPQHGAMVAAMIASCRMSGGSVSSYIVAEKAPIFLDLYRSPVFIEFVNRWVGAVVMPGPDNDPPACALYFYTKRATTSASTTTRHTMRGALHDAHGTGTILERMSRRILSGYPGRRAHLKFSR